MQWHWPLTIHAMDPTSFMKPFEPFPAAEPPPGQRRHHIVKPWRTPRALLGATLLLINALAAIAAPALPPEIEAALQRSRLPRDSVALLVSEVQGQRPPRLALNPGTPMNPASVTKLITTEAALELLGPAFSWQTPVYLDGTVREGTLQGNLVIKGQGDPKLVLERLWLLLRRVQGLGIRQISGDIVLDHSAFELPAANPADFDGEPLKPYNAAADALLINFRSLVLTWVPDPAAGLARVQLDPPMAGVQFSPTVPLLAGECGDWRSQLKAQLADPNRLRFGEADVPNIDNGSGLSRDTRVSAQALTRLLQAAWAGGTMPELLSSLPLSGVDGTLRRLGKDNAAVQGAAHLKTGSLRDVTAVAGVVHGASGRRYTLVAMANHPNANALRPVIEA